MFAASRSLDRRHATTVVLTAQLSVRLKFFSQDTDWGIPEQSSRRHTYPLNE